MNIHRYGKFYKYRSFGDICKHCKSEPEATSRLRELLVDRKVWFASPTSFNDPYDCHPSTRIYDEEHLKRGLFEHFRKLGEQDAHIAERFEELINASPERLDQIGSEIAYGDVAVFSLFTLNASNQQWGYYAASHTGFCLEFEIHAYQPWEGMDSKINWAAYEVMYHRTRLNCNLGEVYGADGDQYVHSMRNALVLLKAPSWAQEEEVRLINSNHGTIQFPPDALTGIILGARISEEK